ncbi:acetate--CoA ligase family protein [Elusimicrobiota bacterium]
MRQIEAILDRSARENRLSLTEPEVYKVLKLLGLKVPMHFILPIKNLPKASRLLDAALEYLPGNDIVLKVSIPGLMHKSDSGGVAVVAKDCDRIIRAAKNMRKRFPKARNILLCEYVSTRTFSLGHELLLGGRYDDAFGHVLSLGIGGTHAQSIMSALKRGYAPFIAPAKELANKNNLKKTMTRAWILNYCLGKVRGSKRLIQDREIIKWVAAFARLLDHFGPDGRSKWLIEEIEINPLAVSSGNLIALDGLLRFKRALKDKRVYPTAKAISSLLEPKSIAIVGVSESMNMGRIILRNMLASGFASGRIHILKKNTQEIDGVKCYKSAASLPGKVDAMIVTVPSKEVPSVIKDAARSRKVRGIVLISGGMGEKKGSKNIRDKVSRIIADAKRSNKDFALNGGNSLGIVSVPAKLNTFFVPEHKMRIPMRDNADIAPTAFISQSGAFTLSVLSRMPWLAPEYIVSVGNQMDVTVVDYVNQVCKRRNIKNILVYCEGFAHQDGSRLAGSISKAVAAGKTVIVYKAGRTQAGSSAATGHTASIAGDWVTAEAVLKRSGAVFADSFDEFNDMAKLSSFMGKFSLKKGNMFLMSNAGFETVGMADNIDRVSSINLAQVDKTLRKKLVKAISASGLSNIVDVNNPLDITPMANDNAVISMMESALSSKNVDCLVVSLVPMTPQLQTLPSQGECKEDFTRSPVMIRSRGLSDKYRKPIVFCIAAGSLYDDYARALEESGFAVFRSADRAIRALSKYINAR